MNKYQEALDNLKEPTEEWLDKKLQLAENMDEPITFKHQSDINILQELVDNPSLKFKELKKGMWVWDDKEKWYRKIVILFEPCNEYCEGSFKSWGDSCETSLDFVEFEENRFYRREVTDEKIQ